MSGTSSSVGSGRGGGDTAAISHTRESSISLQYPILSKTNYSVWAIKMEVYMEAQGVWEAIQSEEPVEKRRDKMALAAIYQGISEETLLQLGPKKTAKEAWQSLRTMHLGADRVKEVRAQALRWELESLRMKDNETIDDFTGKITMTVNRLRSLGEEIEESYVVKKILRAVSPKFLQIASTIEEFGDVVNKTAEEIIGSLKAHEERTRGHDLQDEEQVLLTKAEWESQSSPRSRGRGSWRGGQQGRGYNRSYENRGRGQNDERSRSRFDIRRIRCYNCQESGHFAADCKGKRREEEINFGEEDYNEPTLLMAELHENESEAEESKEEVSDGKGKIRDTSW